MSARILIIDQDSEVLENYRRSLASKSSTWAIITACSEEEALVAAQESAPDIVVASLGLNGGDGLKILSKVVDLAPLAHPFIAAEESAKSELEEAFRGGCRFLPRPCPADQLLLVFQHCLAVESWLENPVVKELFSQRHSFEILPPVYLRIVKALQSSYTTVESIAEIIRADLSLSSKVLETVNSSFYGFDHGISEIPQAVAVLGLESVKNMTLAIQLFDRERHSAEHRALVEELWHHSQAVAVAARRIALFETEDAHAAEEAYSAGLLHDIGKLVLLDMAGDLYMEAQRVAREESIPAWRAEIATIGCDHAEVGAYLLARWGLPQILSETAALHHRPANSSSAGFSTFAAVHAANAIVRKRKNPKHFDARPSQEYLEEIGKAESWPDWEAVAIGATPPSKEKSKPKLKPRESQREVVKTVSAVEVKRATHAGLAHAVERAAIREEERERILNPNSPGKSTMLAFAAGIVFSVGCIYFLTSLGDVKASSHDSPAGEAVVAKSADSAGSEKHGASPTARKSMLDDILETNVRPPASEVTGGETVELPPPPPPPPPPFPEIKLGAIFFQSTGAKAQVNGRILSVGDRVGEARIVGIERTSIAVEHYGAVKSFALD